MAKSKSVYAWASVGSNGWPYACASGRIPEVQGRFEIFDSQKAAERMAISPHRVRRVRIIMGEYTTPYTKPKGKEKVQS